MIPRTLKDEAFALILKGTLIQLSFYLLTVVLTVFTKIQNLLSSSAFFNAFLVPISNLLWTLTGSLRNILILLTFIVGYVFFVRGCLKYARCKGYPVGLGWLGLLSWLGLAVLLLIPDTGTDSDLNLLQENQKINPFLRTNVIEFTLLFIGVLPIAYWLIVLIFSILSGQDFESLLSNLVVQNMISIAWFITAMLVFLKIAKKSNFNFSHLFGFENRISIRDIIILALLNYGVAYFLSPVLLYGISFIFPGYVESYINQRFFTTIPELILWSISAVIMAPIVEEFLCRGLIMQKWSLKWGMKWGILASSLLFAAYHFRFDVLSLTLIGVFFSVLYVRTRSLLAPMLCHALYNIIAVSLAAVSFFRMPVSEREAFISVSAYQASVEPYLGISIFLSMVAALIVAFVLRRFFPRQSEAIPYLRNEERVGRQ